MYTQQEIRETLERWQYIKNQGIINDNYIATIDIETVWEELNEEEKKMATFMKFGYLSSEVSFKMQLSQRTIQRKNKQLIEKLMYFVNKPKVAKLEKKTEKKGKK